MAATLNKVFLMGNLTRDPEMKQTPAGEAIAELGLAVSEQFRSRTTNETREVVTFVDVTVWGKVAENCGQYLQKGRPIFVEGRLVLDTWEDKTTGQKRSRLRVRADRVQFLYSPEKSRRDTNGAAMSSDWAPVAPETALQPQASRPATNAYPATPTSPAPVATPADDEDLPF
ncbi:MAG: single-stranded DNA-binding protein [Kiritimatiellae bacterium]|nr:single-stranded DNA-binding protein [Kiritimatiellia bacterium]